MRSSCINCANCSDCAPGIFSRHSSSSLSAQGSARRPCKSRSSWLGMDQNELKACGPLLLDLFLGDIVDALRKLKLGHIGLAATPASGQAFNSKLTPPGTSARVAPHTFEVPHRACSNCTSAFVTRSRECLALAANVAYKALVERQETSRRWESDPRIFQAQEREPHPDLITCIADSHYRCHARVTARAVVPPWSPG